MSDQSQLRKEHSIEVNSGGQFSNTIDLGNETLAGLITNDTLTSTVASIYVGASDGNMVLGPPQLQDLALTKALAFEPALTAAWRYVQLYLHSAEGGARSLKFISRPLK